MDLDEFQAILFEMELIKEVGIALEAIKEIGNKYLRLQENGIVKASGLQGSRIGTVLSSIVCLA